MLFDDPIVLHAYQRVVENRVSMCVTFICARARGIIVKYFIRPRYFPWKNPILRPIISLYPAITRFSQKIHIKTFSPANHCYFHIAVTAMVNIVTSLVCY